MRVRAENDRSKSRRLNKLPKQRTMAENARKIVAQRAGSSAVKSIRTLFTKTQRPVQGKKHWRAFLMAYLPNALMDGEPGRSR